jgi:sugar O-acyltransferase (sialic acid O-acetyltransferase NeuD family)
MERTVKEIAIFGAGGFGLEVAMLIEHINEKRREWKLIGFFDDGLPKGKMVNDYQVLGGIGDLNTWDMELHVAFALGIPETKMAVIQQVENPNIKYPTLIHPSAILGNMKFLAIGEGTIICAGSIITSNIRIGKHVILNLACTVGHETSIGDYGSFMPTCNISGEVTIGIANFWGTGAKIINRCTVGDNVIIGAGAVVINDIPSNVTAVGVPARVVENRNISEL